MLELNNKEYKYEDICADLGWKPSSGAQRERQIKCVEESYDFYHPINKKTNKEKKSYIFTKMIKEPVLEDTRGGERENAGRKNDFPEEEFDYLWKVFVSEGYKRNKYHERSWLNKIYFTSSLLFEMFGFSYGAYMNRVKFDENDDVTKEMFQNIVRQAVKANTVGKLCKRYGFKKNSLPKGILRARSRFRLNQLIDDDDLLEKYEKYFAEEMETLGYKSKIEVIKNKKYFYVCSNIQKKFEAEDKYKVECMNMIKVDDFDVIANGESFGDKKLINVYRKHFREIIFTSVEKSCLNRIEHGEKYKTKLNENQKKLLMSYLFQLLGKEVSQPIVVEDYAWLDLVC